MVQAGKEPERDRACKGAGHKPVLIKQVEVKTKTKVEVKEKTAAKVETEAFVSCDSLNLRSSPLLNLLYLFPVVRSLLLTSLATGITLKNSREHTILSPVERTGHPLAWRVKYARP